MAIPGITLLRGNGIGNGIAISKPPVSNILPLMWRPKRPFTRCCKRGLVNRRQNLIIFRLTLTMIRQVFSFKAVSRTFWGRIGVSLPVRSCQPSVDRVNPPRTARGPSGMGCINGKIRIMAINAKAVSSSVSTASPMVRGRCFAVFANRNNVLVRSFTISQIEWKGNVLVSSLAARPMRMCVVRKIHFRTSGHGISPLIGANPFYCQPWKFGFETEKQRFVPIIDYLNSLRWVAKHESCID